MKSVIREYSYADGRKVYNVEIYSKFLFFFWALENTWTYKTLEEAEKGLLEMLPPKSKVIKEMIFLY
jgi:hypothetical protein